MSGWKRQRKRFSSQSSQPTGVFVYHIVPDNMVGSILYPLNELRRLYPEVASRHASKYVGREAVTTISITPLGCLWNDVLMFAPVHPGTLMTAYREAGHDRPPLRWYELPAERLSPDNTVTTLPLPPQWRPGDQLSFLPYSVEYVRSLRDLPEHRRPTFGSAVPGGPPLLFARIAHVFHRGTVSIRSLRVLEA